MLRIYSKNKMPKLFEIPRYLPARKERTLLNHVVAKYPTTHNVWHQTSLSFYYESCNSFRARLRIMVPISDLAARSDSLHLKILLSVQSIPENKERAEKETFIFHVDPGYFDYDSADAALMQEVSFKTVVLLKHTTAETNIPKVIVQTSTTRLVNFKLFSACMSLVDQNPEFEYVFMDDSDVDDYVSQFYAESVVELFRSIIPGAYKADVFRYMFLENSGGFYFDCKMIAKAPISSVIGLNDDPLVVCKDRPFEALYNAMIFSRAQTPEIKKVTRECLARLAEIKRCTDAESMNKTLCKYGVYGITGPALLWQVLAPKILGGTLTPQFLFSTATGAIHRRNKHKELAYVHLPLQWNKEPHHGDIFLIPHYRDYYYDYTKIHGDVSYKEHFFRKSIMQ